MQDQDVMSTYTAVNGYVSICVADLQAQCIPGVAVG
jgi:hypothetical protein